MEKNYIIANVKDKINLAKKRNKIQNTSFYTASEKIMIEKELNYVLNEKRYIFSGGYDDAEREVLILYPEKFNEAIAIDNINFILKAIRIRLPNELIGKYTHSLYLGALMKIRAGTWKIWRYNLFWRWGIYYIA